MSSQRIGNDLRHSIWLAHNRRCSYCTEPLPFGEMDVDHIIPEHLSDDDAGLAAVLIQNGLPLDFDIRSLRNLLPAHRRCNRAKSKGILAIGATGYFLALAERAVPRVEDLLAGKSKHDRRDTVLSTVAQALQSGLIETDDLLRDPLPPDALILTKPLVFVDGSESAISPEQVESFLDRPVLVGGDPVHSTRFIDDGDGEMIVRTCRAYRAALAAGYYAPSTFDMKMEAYLKTANAILTAASTVRIPNISYIDNPFAGLSDLHLLPVEVLPDFSPESREEIRIMKGQRLADLFERGEMKLLRISSHEIAFEWGNHSGLQMREVFRADLDGDGVKDILCDWYCWAIGGTLGIGSTVSLSKKSFDAPFESSFT